MVDFAKVPGLRFENWLDKVSRHTTEIHDSRTDPKFHSMDNHRETFDRYGYSLTVVQTGIPPALTAKLLVTGEITERGVMMPEALAPDALMNNFSKEGLRIFVEKREVEELG